MEVGFPKEYTKDLEGLLFFGKLSHSFKFKGHDFTIKTLTNGELFNAGLVTSQYNGTKAQQLAYKTALVSLCIESVDGIPIVEPLGPDNDTAFKKFDIVKEWFPIVIDKIWLEYVGLEAKVKEIVDSLGE